MIRIELYLNIEKYGFNALVFARELASNIGFKSEHDSIELAKHEYGRLLQNARVHFKDLILDYELTQV